MSLTIKDVAKIAGVSHTTVSRVINNYPLVKHVTREKVLQVIKDLNFSPHSSARSLSSGKTYAIGLLILYDLQQFPADFLPAILVGMATELNHGGYNLMLFFDKVNGKKNQISLETLNRNNLDGIFILSVETEAELIYKIAKIDLPMVLVNENVEGIKSNYVIADDKGGAYSAVSHLLEQGHKKIAFIGGTKKYKTSIDREEGYRTALRDHDIIIDPALEKVGYFSINRGYQAMCELLDERPDITAVFAANDLMAIGSYKAIKERNLKIPDNIAVVGFDATEYAEALNPPLTTVKKMRTHMGKEAARIMLELLNSKNKDEVKQIVLPTKLIICQSSIKII